MKFFNLYQYFLIFEFTITSNWHIIYKWRFDGFAVKHLFIISIYILFNLIIGT